MCSEIADAIVYIFTILMIVFFIGVMCKPKKKIENEYGPTPKAGEVWGWKEKYKGEYCSFVVVEVRDGWVLHVPDVGSSAELGKCGFGSADSVDEFTKRNEWRKL